MKRQRRPVPITTTPEQQLIARLLAFCERSATKGGHLAMIEPNEHLGVCNTKRRYVGGTRVPDGAGYRMEGQMLDGECTESCQEFTAALEDAREYLSESRLEVAS